MRPNREHATNTDQTYMITSSTWGRRSLFSREPWARLLIDTVYNYRGTAYLLHEFVVMPDHVHVILTPKTSLEKAVQFIKGGFSYRAKKDLGSNMEVWQKGFSDHRIRDAQDYRLHRIYIQQNPVRKRLRERPEEYAYSSAKPGFDLDAAPQGLKPLLNDDLDGAPEGAPFQTKSTSGAAKTAPLQVTSQGLKPLLDENEIGGAAEAAPLQSGVAKAASAQSVFSNN